MTVLTADELRTKGVSGIEQRLQNEQEVVITVRGKPRFVVMEIARYKDLRERELEVAWVQTREDIAAGRFRQEAVADHIARIQTELSDDL